MRVAKLVIIDGQDKYLLLERTNHPSFPDDPDLPGGTIEEGESALDAMVREVAEEVGVTVNPTQAQQLYAGDEYSRHHTHYSLYGLRLQNTPQIQLSWEHTAYHWLKKEDFLEVLKSSKDTYMLMVFDVISSNRSF